MVVAVPVGSGDWSWRDERPAYRVHIWSEAPEGFAPTLYEWRVAGARDVREVLDWVEAKSAGRTFEVFVEARQSLMTAAGVLEPADGLIRLVGSNPVAGTPVASRFDKA